MDQVVNFFKKLLDTKGFPPRWLCGTGWDDFTGWFHIISDLLVWSAYFAIPLIIIRYITTKTDARFTKIYFLFASFILACGSTHLIDVILFWHPVYRFSALIRFFTGVISWVTVFALLKLLPVAFSLKTAQELETEVEHRKQAEEQLRQQNKLLNDAQEIARLGFWEWDVQRNKVLWSDSMFRIYGRKKQEISYENFLDFVHSSDRGYVNATIQKAFEEKKFPEFYHRVVGEDGTIRTLHAKGDIVLHEDGSVAKMIGTSQDVTEQKKVEQELLTKSQDLESTNIELQKFASIASHDLREPLRKIIMFSGLLEQEVKSDNTKAISLIHKIVNSGSRMQMLIDDILDFSRLSKDKFVFEKVDLKRIVNQVISDIEVTVKEKNARIIVDKLPVIEANAGQMTQLFQNLISNAIKFSKEDEQPVVKITSKIISGAEVPKDFMKLNNYQLFGDPAFWENEQFASIRIEDNGIGFDETYLNKIFLIFQRLHSRTQYEGTGIGLAICKKVVDIHHGSITAYSKPEQGATFEVLLPVSQFNFRNPEGG